MKDEKGMETIIRIEFYNLAGSKKEHGHEKK